MRFYLSFSPAVGLVFLWDDGQGLPGLNGQVVGEVVHSVSKPGVSASPALLRDPVQRPLLTNYLPNRKAVSCAKCKSMIAKGAGYKQFFPGGYLCEYCQSEAGLPVRPVAEVRA
jgi:hypothetical protein